MYCAGDARKGRSTVEAEDALRIAIRPCVASPVALRWRGGRDRTYFREAAKARRKDP